MLLRHKLYFVAVVVAVTTFLVSFHLGSMRHAQSYNSGIIGDVVSAVVEKEKINPYKPSLPGKLLRASAYKYGPSNGTSRKIDFAHFWPIDWP